MKKNSVIKIVSVVLSFILLLSGCGSDNNEESTGEETPIEENRYINCDPQYKNSSSSGETGCLVGPRSYNLTLEGYLIDKEKTEFTAGENWLPWEQFSALGEFYSSFWWDHNPKTTCYKYLYTDSKTGKFVLYRVYFEKIPEDSGVTNIKEYYQWRYGREYDETMGDALSLTKSDLSNSDLTRLKFKDGAPTAFYENILFISDDLDLVRFVYNGWEVGIFVSRTCLGQDHPVYGKEEDIEKNCVDKFGIADSDIVKRLLNADTCMAAIKELMNPANGGYASG